MTAAERTEAAERTLLSARAVCAADSKGRARPEPDCPLRTCFQRDIDRIVHAKSFRRLKHKTQCFLSPEGDHYRTRLTHAMEVSRIARTLARALRLNEDLTEAIALGHDLGHTAFGHAGEEALQAAVPGGFCHRAQGLRVVDILENDGQGLNLTAEVRDGIAHHSGDQPAATLEGQLVHLADRIAYLNHDLDDALRGGVLQLDDLPGALRALGERASPRIDALVTDVVACTEGTGVVGFSPACAALVAQWREFMFARVYRNPVAKGEESKVGALLRMLYDYYLAHPDELPAEYPAAGDKPRAVCDYVAGMTDRYAVARYQALFIPKGWRE